MAAPEELLVTGIAHGGYGIARTAVGVVFVDGAIPGELVLARIVRSARQSRFAEVESVISPSPHRVEPPCPHFGECGGCQWQFIGYPAQLAFKEEILRDCLRRIGGIEIPPTPPNPSALAGEKLVNPPALAGGAVGYRYRARLSVSKRGEIGFLRRGSHDVVAFDNCVILRDELNDAIRSIRAAPRFMAGGEIAVVCGDNGVAAAVNGDFIADPNRFIRETGLSGLDVNGKRYGNPAIGFDLSGLRYTVSARSFFQANWRLNLKMVEAVCGLLPPGAAIADIYAGAGNFAIALAARGHDVTAVEGDKSSFADGARNAKHNKLGNLRFLRSSAEAAIARLKPVDVMIVDPPRTGIEPAAVEAVMLIRPPQLIYVSCDPATLARDMKKLSRLYNVESARLVDMFPQTGHIEALTNLRLR